MGKHGSNYDEMYAPNVSAVKHEVDYLLGALRTVASVAKERGISDLYGVAQAGLDLYIDGPSDPSPEEIEIVKLRKELAEQIELKEGWIAEYTKLRDMGKMPPDEYA